MKIFGKLIKIVFISAMVTGASFASGTGEAPFNFADQANDTMETVAEIGYISPTKLRLTRESLKVISDPEFDPSSGSDSETRRTKLLLWGTVGVVTPKRIKEMNECFAVSDSPIEVNIESIGYNVSRPLTIEQIEKASSLFYKVVSFPSRRATYPTTPLTNPFIATYYTPDGTLLHSHKITRAKDYIDFLNDCAFADQYTVTYPALGKINIQYNKAVSFPEDPTTITGGASAGAGCITTPFTPSHLVSSTDSSLTFIIYYKMLESHRTPIAYMYPIHNAETAIKDFLSRGFIITDSKPGTICLLRNVKTSSTAAAGAASSRVGDEE